MDLDGKVLLDDCTCSIVSGRRFGLVGKNGSGKTTFLKHLAAKAFKQGDGREILALRELQVNYYEMVDFILKMMDFVLDNDAFILKMMNIAGGAY